MNRVNDFTKPVFIKEKEDMVNEIKYSKFVREGHIENMIDVYELFKLYMNHRPYKGNLLMLSKK